MTGNEKISGAENPYPLARGKFSVLLNLAIPKYQDLEIVTKNISFLQDSITGIIISDPPSSIGMDRLLAAALVKERTGIDVVFPIHCRDKNRSELISTLLGARAAGIQKILLITGTHTTLLGFPSAKPTFDLDSTQLLKLAYKILNSEENEGEQSPQLLGCSVNPNLSDPQIEMFRLKRKMEFSPAFLISLPIINIDSSRPLMEELEKLKVPIIYGLLPYSCEDHFLRVMAHRPADFPRSPYEIQFATLLEQNVDRGKLEERIDDLNQKWLLSAMKSLSQRAECAGVYLDIRLYPRIISKLPDLVKKFKKTAK